MRCGLGCTGPTGQVRGLPDCRLLPCAGPSADSSTLLDAAHPVNASVWQPSASRQPADLLSGTSQY